MKTEETILKEEKPIFNHDFNIERSKIYDAGFLAGKEAERKSNEEEMNKLDLECQRLAIENVNLKQQLKDKEEELEKDSQLLNSWISKYKKLEQQLSSQKEKILEDLNNLKTKEIMPHYDDNGIYTEVIESSSGGFVSIEDIEALKNKIESKQEVSTHSPQEVSNEGEKSKEQIEYENGKPEDYQ